MARGLGNSVLGASLDQVLLGVGLVRKQRGLQWRRNGLRSLLGAQRDFCGILTKGGSGREEFSAKGS